MATRRCMPSSRPWTTRCVRCWSGTDLPVWRQGFPGPGEVVSYTDDAGIQSGKKFPGPGPCSRAAAGVPLQVRRGADFQTTCIDLFGLEKLRNVERTVAHLLALDKLKPAQATSAPEPALHS